MLDFATSMLTILCDHLQNLMHLHPKGTPQYIQLIFPVPVVPRRAEFTFQGGFAGIKCSVEALRSGGDSEWEEMTRIYPDDVNRMQIFDLIPTHPSMAQWRVDGLKFVFEESSDFFGRVTVYDLQLLGTIEN